MDTQATTYDLHQLLATDVRTALPPDAVTAVTSQAPFVHVPGAFNVRDLGCASLRCGFAYRSGALGSITDEGAAALRGLGVRIVFDLRNAKEKARHPGPTIEGVDVIWEPYTRDPDATNPEDFSEEDDGVGGFVGMYTHILEIATPIFRRVFEHIRDRPQEPFLFHCTAGKDRTGVLAALILLLVESPSSAIVQDYLLTRVGIEPARDILMSAFQASNIGGSTLDDFGVRSIASVRAGSMMAFIKAIDENFGGVSGYLMTELGFSAVDVAVIAANLKAATAPPPPASEDDCLAKTQV